MVRCAILQRLVRCAGSAVSGCRVRGWRGVAALSWKVECSTSKCPAIQVRNWSSSLGARMTRAGGSGADEPVQIGEHVPERVLDVQAGPVGPGEHPGGGDG